MNEEEKRKYEAFQYWIQTNTEKGVTTIPDNLCLFVVNLIKSLQKENEKLNNRCRNLDKEAQAYLEELAGDNTLTRRTIKQLQEENEELNEKILDNAGIYQLGFKDGEESYIKKVKDKIRKNEEIIDISNDGDLIHELYQKNKVYEELLESEK
jgi:hypothetical protein